MEAKVYDSLTVSKSDAALGSTVKEAPNWIKRLLFFCLVVLSIVFIAIGIVSAEYVTVFDKAARVCLECIGIG